MKNLKNRPCWLCWRVKRVARRELLRWFEQELRLSSPSTRPREFLNEEPVPGIRPQMTNTLYSAGSTRLFAGLSLRCAQASNSGSAPLQGGALTSGRCPHLQALFARRAVDRMALRGGREVLFCIRRDNRSSPFAGTSSPLTDSNRRPPPYHGGFDQLLPDVGTALASVLSLHFA